MKVLRRLFAATADAVVWLFVLGTALSVIGAFAPALPVASGLGLIPSLLGPILLLLLLIATAIRGRRWAKRRRVGDAALSSIALVTALGLGFLLMAQVRAARASGARIDLLRPFGLWIAPLRHDSPEPFEILYLHSDGEDLHVLIFRPSRARLSPAPILVYVHGGGWVKLTQHFRSPDMRWFADRGYLVVSVQYGLSDEHRHMWNLAQPQVGCALAWVDRNAAQLGGDPARLAVIGDSAGGNLVLGTAYAAAAGKLRPACAGTLPAIAAAIAIYPVADAAGFFRNPGHGGVAEGAEDARQYVGGSPEQFPARYAFVSPASYVSPKTPPTLFLLGQADTLVPPAATRALADRLAAAGVPVRTIEMPFAPHAYDVMPGGIGNQLTRQATLHFLVEHGAAP